MKKIIYIYFILASIFASNVLFAENIHFLDYRYILNESIAGKKAQTELKSKLDKNIKSIQNKEKSIREEEKKIIQQKKIISSEEYAFIKFFNLFLTSSYLAVVSEDNTYVPL